MKCVRRAIVFSLLAAMGFGATATPETLTGDAEPLCVIAPAAMPREWRPANPLPNSLSGNTWTSAEAKDAEYAARRGLEELTDYFSARPQSVLTLREDAVEPFLDASYAASNTPDLRRAALDEGRRVLTPLLEPYLRRQPESAKCDEY